MKMLRYILLTYLLVSIVKFLFSLSVPYPMYLSDERQYLEMARSFLATGEFRFEGEIWHHYPPLYPIIIAITTLFRTDIAFILIKLINAFLSSTIIFPIYLLSKEFLNKKYSFALSTLSLFVPESFVYSYNILAENLYYPLFIFSIYFFYKSLKTTKKKFHVLTGIFVGLSILTKTIGLTLFAGIMVALFIHSVLLKKSFGTILKSYKNYWILFTIILIMILPWYLRNVYYFGTSIYGITGYPNFSSSTTQYITALSYIYYATINIAFLAIGSGLIFLIFSLYAIKIKGIKDFKIIFWSFFIILILLSTFWSFTNGGRGDKIMGRYTTPAIFLILIMGGIGIESFQKKRNTKILFYAIMICSLVLVSVPIDIRMGSFDSLSTIFLLAPKQANTLGLTSFTTSDFLIKIVLIFSPLVIFSLEKYLSWNNIFWFTIIFLILNTTATTIAVRYGSLDAEEFMQLAFWMRDNLSKGNILFDIREYSDHEELFWSIEAVKFWTDFTVLEKNYNTYSNDYDYVISKRELPLTKLKELDTVEGVYDRKALKIFIYEK